MTFRLRLTLLNVGVLALALAAFAALLLVSSRRQALARLDTELQDRARRTGIRPPPMMRPPFGRGPLAPHEAPLPGDDPRGGFRRALLFDPSGRIVAPPDVLEPFDPDAVRTALEGRAVLSTRSYRGNRIRVFTMPMEDPMAPGGAVQVAQDMRDLDELWRAQWQLLLLLMPLALGAAGAAALFLTRKALRPVEQVTRAAEQITEHDLRQRLGVSGNDELARLAQTFNGLIARLDEAFEARRQSYQDLEQAYEQQRQFTADASHELRSPLTRLQLATSSALEDPRAAADALKVADQAGRAMAKLVDELLTLSRADAGQLRGDPAELDLRVPVSEVAEEMGTARSRSIEVSLPEKPLMVWADDEYVRRILRNLLENAARATPEGQIGIRTWSETEFAVTEVWDHGVGIPARDLERVFDRFYRVDSARSRKDGGSGLGLSICQTLAELQEGRLKIDSGEGRGTRAILYLPLLQQKSGAS